VNRKTSQAFETHKLIEVCRNKYPRASIYVLDDENVTNGKAQKIKKVYPALKVLIATENEANATAWNDWIRVSVPYAQIYFLRSYFAIDRSRSDLQTFGQT